MEHFIAHSMCIRKSLKSNSDEMNLSGNLLANEVSCTVKDSLKFDGENAA